MFVIVSYPTGAGCNEGAGVVSGVGIVSGVGVVAGAAVSEVPVVEETFVGDAEEEPVAADVGVCTDPDLRYTFAQGTNLGASIQKLA